MIKNEQSRSIYILITLLLFHFQSFAQFDSRNEQGTEAGKLDLKEDSVAFLDATNGWWKDANKNLDTRMSWYSEAKFGCFIHWGVYSALAGKYDGQIFGGYSEHIMRALKIPVKNYREDVVATFNPTMFDADQWMKRVADAGMKYFIITAKHHDGFAMYESKAYGYDIMDSQYKKDPMVALRAAAKKYGIKFGFYYSHAFDWEDPDAPGNDWDYPQNPGGDRLVNGAEWWLNNPSFLANTTTYLQEKVLPQLTELIENYDPDILWFDTPHKLPLYQNILVLKHIRSLSPNLVVNGRLANLDGHHIDNPVQNLGDYENTADRPAYLRKPDAKYWEAIPTTNESYGYSTIDTSHKSPQFFIHLLASATSKGGNILMNIGPMGNGMWDDKDVAIVSKIGKWLAVNGSAIYGTEYTGLPIQNWGVTTKKDNKLFLHVFDWPENGRLIVNGIHANVAAAKALASGATVKTKQINKTQLEVDLAAITPDSANTVIELTTKTPYQITDESYLLKSENYILVFNAKTNGDGLTYGDGKKNRHYIDNWTQKDQTISWTIKSNKTKEYQLDLEYNTKGNTDSGSIKIFIDDKPIRVDYTAYPESKGLARMPIGKVKIRRGTHTITLRGNEITSGKTFLRPTGLFLNAK